MMRCKQCHKLGLFRTIDPTTGICLECEQSNMKRTDEPRNIIPLRSSIHVPRYYIGNNMRYIVTDSFDSIPLRVVQDFDFSLLKLKEECSCRSVDGAVSVFIKWDVLVGHLFDERIDCKILKSFDCNLPIFIRICDFDSNNKTVNVCIAFYKIDKYDYSPDFDSHFDDIDFDDIEYC